MINVLTAENVTKYAQDAMPLMPLDCEWGGMCESELNSWSSLREVSVNLFITVLSSRLHESEVSNMYPHPLLSLQLILTNWSHSQHIHLHLRHLEEEVILICLLKGPC